MPRSWCVGGDPSDSHDAGWTAVDDVVCGYGVELTVDMFVVLAGNEVESLPTTA